MINGNRLEFGYGDIAVGSYPLTQELTFTGFRPPATPGESLVDKDLELLTETIKIHIDHYLYGELKEKLQGILDRRYVIFGFEGYTFDFSNYNEESVKVCICNLDNAMLNYIFLLAC